MPEMSSEKAVKCEREKLLYSLRHILLKKKSLLEQFNLIPSHAALKNIFGFEAAINCSWFSTRWELDNYKLETDEVLFHVIATLKITEGNYKTEHLMQGTK